MTQGDRFILLVSVGALRRDISAGRSISIGVITTAMLAVEKIGFLPLGIEELEGLVEEYLSYQYQTQTNNKLDPPRWLELLKD